MKAIRAIGNALITAMIVIAVVISYVYHKIRGTE